MQAGALAESPRAGALPVGRAFRAVPRAGRVRAIRVALVANPESGLNTDRAALDAELRSAGAEVVCFDLDQLEEAPAWGVDRLVVAGGDGMLGPAAEAAQAASVPFALIPTGTANDFARGMGLSLDPVEACRVAVRGRRTLTLDLARMDGRPFVNTASVGLSANAADRAVPLKKVIGRFAYMFGAAWAGFTESPVPCRITCDGSELFAGKAWQVIVANSGRFGAGSSVEEADPGDGLLDATVVPAGSRVKLPRYAYAMRRGRISSAGQARHGQGCHVRLEVPEDESYNVDGEVVCHGSSDFRVERAAARIVLS